MNWNNVKYWITSSLTRTIATFLLILLLSMGSAAIVNYISTDPLFAKAFFVGGTVGFVAILLGVFIFYPFFAFRFKFNFLEPYEEKMAKKLFYLNKRSKNLVKSEDGILALQFFEVEKHTYNNEIKYEFSTVIDQRGKPGKRGISDLKPKKINVPFGFHQWLMNFRGNLVQPLQDFKSVNPMVYHWIRRTYQDLISETTKLSEKRRLFRDYINTLNNWNVSLKNDFKCVHFVSIFNVIDIIPDENSENYLANGNYSQYIYKMRYNGKKDKHKNRSYFAAKISYDMDIEGKYEFIFLLVADDRLISQPNGVAEIIKYVLAESS